MARMWELRIIRMGEQLRTKRRTVGTYQIFHDGVAVAGLSGACAETRGPGDNSTAGNNRCIEAGRYPLATQDGEKYCTIGYTSSLNHATLRRPALLVRKTNKRVGILLHPGRGFLSSIGCINPCKSLKNASANIEFIDSRNRTIAIIDDLAQFLGADFPTKNGRPIPDAFMLIS